MSKELTIFQMVSPTMDIYEEKNKLVIKVAIPGLEEKEIKVKLTSDTITISGEKKAKQEIKESGYYLKESRFGSFYRSASLPVKVDAKKAKKKMDSGILTITVPKKKEKTKTKKKK